MDIAPHASRAIEYAQSVVDGRIPAAKPTMDACRRMLSDLEKQGTDEFPYRYDHTLANHACDFIEGLPHVKGRWAVPQNGDPESVLIRLEMFQSFIVCNIFGWVHVETGKRRFQKAYVEMCRKNGKSLLAACIGLYMLAMDGENGSEVYSGATSEKQAWEVFRPARLIVKRTDELRAAAGLTVGAKSVFVENDESRFEPVIGKPGDGASPHCAIIDEYHEHKTDELVETMATGMGSREQPLLFMITTAGVDLGGPCYAQRGDAIKVLDGTMVDDRLFAIIYTIDDGDDWTTMDALRKANPNLGVSVSEDYLVAQQRDAVNIARKQNAFKTKHLDVWCGARTPWMNMESWNRCADPDLSIDDFTGEPAIIGGDVSAKKDLATWVRVFRRMVDGEEHYYVFGKHYLPEDTVEDPANDRYRGWMNAEDLRVTDGQILDLDEIELDIIDAASSHPITEAAFDPWGAYQLMSNLMSGKNGRPIECVEIPQTVRFLSEPMKWLAAFVEAGRVHHNGDPILTWCVSNVTVREDPNENIFPRKERREQKIDAAVAMILAFNRIVMGDEKTESVYETRGLLTTRDDSEDQENGMD